MLRKTLKKMKLYREYEKECLKRWKSFDIDIEALQDIEKRNYERIKFYIQ